MNPVVELSEQSKRDIAQMVIAELIAIGAATPRPAPVLTLAEAMKMAKKKTDEAFYAWARKYGPVTCGHGRYSRARVEMALDREARKHVLRVERRRKGD